MDAGVKAGLIVLGLALIPTAGLLAVIGILANKAAEAIDEAHQEIEDRFPRSLP